MITAKNYAAQAEVGLIKYIGWLKSTGQIDEAKYTGGIVNGLRNGVKFVIPDEGVILDDDLKGIMSKQVRLPFRVTVIEYARTPKVLDKRSYAIDKLVMLCIELEEAGEFSIHPIVHYIRGKGDERWLPSAYEAIIPSENQLRVGGDGRVEFHSQTIQSRAIEYKGMVDDDGETHDEDKVHMEILSHCIAATYELLEALSCTNIEQSIYQPASPKNAQRIKSHKAPIYETRYLTLKTTKKESFGGGDGTSSHKSPKQHLRRGHIRRLEKGNIWVNSCVVGDASNGIIDKYYKIKK